ncbi:hypothetical protein ACIA8O_18470 [Kitasatospora sp. NPDC051853]|uniref:hypothetical protein n=1 Tax=Kitasatospora sp. NPDC051853 TaxID=3364058 RepID=UPI003795AF9E
MSAILTSVIAVLGTLLGSFLTHAFQQRSATHAERGAQAERLRQERLEVYGAYAGLLVEFRQAVLHHWFCLHRGTDAAEEPALRAKSFELRSQTQHAVFRLQLIADSPELTAAATAAFETIGRIDRAADLEDVERRRDATRDLIDAFVATARHHL